MADDKEALNQNNITKDHPQPGAVISPGSDDTPASVPKDNKPTQEPVELPKTPDIEEPTEIDNAKFTSKIDEEDNVPDSSPDTLTWSAPEFISHDKSTLWYVVLIIVALVLSILFYILMKDIVTVIVVIIGALFFGIYGSRQPKLVDYELNNLAVVMGNKEYHYSEFRTFTVIKEANISDITFTPLKRFSPPLSIYFETKNEDKVINLIANHIPFEQTKPDAVESLMRRIHF